jgi:hypothetical protein
MHQFKENASCKNSVIEIIIQAFESLKDNGVFHVMENQCCSRSVIAHINRDNSNMAE